MDSTLRHEATRAIERAALNAFEGDVHAIILKGSALKEDFVPGYSDLDIHIYVSSRCMRGGREPRLENAIRFQRAIGALAPEDYGVSSFQIYFIDAENYPEDWSKPLGGTYELVYGSAIDDSEPVEERLKKSREHLAAYADHIGTLVGRFVDKPDTEVPPLVRLAGAILKGAIYSAAAVTTEDPTVIVAKTVYDLLGVIEEGGVETRPARSFFSRIQDWAELKRDAERCREAFGLAIQGIQNICDWYSSL